MHRLGYHIQDHSLKGCSGEKGKLFQNVQGKSLSPVFHVNAQVVAQNAWLWCIYFVSLVLESHLLLFIDLKLCVLKANWSTQECGNLVKLVLIFFSSTVESRKIKRKDCALEKLPGSSAEQFSGDLWTHWSQKARANFLQWVRFPHGSPTLRDGWDGGPIFILAAFCSSYEVFYMVFTAIYLLLFYFLCYWNICQLPNSESRITGCYSFKVTGLFLEYVP